MSYRLMRLRKYYDAIRTNKPFLKAPFRQKKKILLNILKYFKSKKSVILDYKPVIAQIESTSNCNLRCEMCIREKIGVPIGNMSFENFKKILDKLDCLFKVHLQGQGEPFLNQELFDMIKYANEKGIVVMLNTNGTALTKGIIDKICRAYIGGISVSIDSAKKEKYEKIRKGASFEKVTNNVKALTSELKRRKKLTIVSLVVVVLKENLEELLDFVKFAEELGIKKIIFQIIQAKEDYVRQYENGAKKQIAIDRNEIKGKIKEVKEAAKRKKIFVVFDQEKIGRCIWPWRSIYITWNGHVTPCCKILDYRKPMFGNILKEDFWKIWNGKEYQIFRKLLTERKAPFPCRGCELV